MEERIQILEMLVAGKLTVEEADLLLEAITPSVLDQATIQMDMPAKKQSSALLEPIQVLGQTEGMR